MVCCLALNAYAKDPALLSLSLEHFRDTATVKDDPLDAKAVISTQNGYVERTGPMHMVWHDEFLSAAIDKKTGQKSFAVHEEITYSGSSRAYQTASYESANGPRSVPAAQISKDVVNCAVAECIYTERVAFPVEEDLLRQLAAAHVPAKPVIWSYKLMATSGPSYTGGLSNAEIAGLLAKVDQYTGTPPVAAAEPARSANRLDLGIGGMAVAAAEEQPDRGGILITAVHRGSVAHKSGMIVGDILYEFGGRPIKEPAELRAAVAACEAKATVPIKLYRGTDKLAVSAQF
jgi:hypothetical protein